jgi:hypothetical protein
VFKCWKRGKKGGPGRKERKGREKGRTGRKKKKKERKRERKKERKKERKGFAWLLYNLVLAVFFVKD